MQLIKRGGLVPAALVFCYALSAEVVSAKTVQLYKLPPASDFPAILSQLPSDMNQDWLKLDYERNDWQYWEETDDQSEDGTVLETSYSFPRDNTELTLDESGISVFFANSDRSWQAMIECTFKGQDHTKADCGMSLDNLADAGRGYGRAVIKKNVTLTPFTTDAVKDMGDEPPEYDAGLER